MGARSLVVIFLAIGVAVPEAAAAAFRVAPDRYGPIREGMTAAEAGAALGAEVKNQQGPFECSLFKLPGRQRPVQLIATEGEVLDMIMVHGRGVRTTRGIQIGDGLRKLRRRYGSRLHRTRAGNDLSGSAKYFAVTKRVGGHVDMLRFALGGDNKVRFMEAGPRKVVLGFGECA